MAGGVKVAMKKDKKLIILGGIIVGCVIGIISIIISMAIKMSKQREGINANAEAKIEQEREEPVKLTVQLEHGISEKEIQWIGEKILEIDGVIECDYVTSGEAWEQFQKEYFGDSPEVAEGFYDDNPFSSGYYEVNTSTDKIEYVIKTIQQIEEVRAINKMLSSEVREQGEADTT